MSALTSIINNEEKLYEGDLRHYFRSIFFSRGANNPYHNIRHGVFILEVCYDAIKYYRYHNYGAIEETLLDNRALLIGGLLHDADHSGRSGNDDLNIELACRFLDKVCLEEDRQIKNKIKKYFRSTEFGPNGHVYTAKSEYEKVLRDADLSQIAEPSWLRMILFGLAKEMQVAPIQMLTMQESFLSNVRFESRWGKQKFGNAIKDKIEEAKELVKILEN